MAENGWGQGVQIAGIVVAIALSATSTLRDTGREDVRMAEARLTSMIASVESRAALDSQQLRESLLQRATENRESIKTLDERVTANVTAEQERNNRLESKLASVAMRVGIYNGSMTEPAK